MAARFVALLPDRPAQAWRLAEGRQHVVGRDADCDLVVADDRVSRRHLSLEGRDGTWRLRDLGSKNGTTVDGRTVETTELPPVAWIGLGSLSARFEARAPVDGGRERVLAASRAFEHELATAVDEEEVLDRLLASVARVSGMERAFVLLSGDQGQLEVAARRGLEAGDLVASEFRGSLGAVERALGTGAPVASHDTASDASLGSRESVREGGIRALVCLPLTGPGGSPGVLYADSRVPGRLVTALELEILTTLADHALVAVGLLRTRRELAALAAAKAPGAAALTWQEILSAHRMGEGA